jgi:hypothetical protein
VRSRTLHWDGCVNARDLGGLPTEDGGETRWQSLVRADSVRGLSDAGWAALVGYGVRTAIDLRWESELREDPEGEVPVDVVHLSLFGETRDGEFAEVDALVADVADPVTRRRTTYIEFLERFRGSFAGAVREVASAPPEGVVIHCSGGADRTGLVAAILLRISGVTVGDIADDWAESERNWAPFIAEWIATAGDEAEAERRRLLSLRPAEAMLLVLAEVERRYGSVESYLRAAGVADRDIARARARLRG